MVKKIAAMFLALSFIGLLAIAPNAHARRGQPEPPECQVEDGGILVCK